MENKQEVERVRNKTEIQADIYRCILSGMARNNDIHDIVKQILAIPELCIKADDQSLPNNPHDITKREERLHLFDVEPRNAYRKALKDMLKPDKDGCVWVKVIPKGEK